jgi:hypothetical protein
MEDDVMESECESCGVVGPHYVWSSCSRTAMDLTARMEDRLADANDAPEAPGFSEFGLALEETVRRLREPWVGDTADPLMCGHGMLEAARMEMACRRWFDLEERENARLRTLLCQDVVDGLTLEEMIHVHDEIDEEHLINLVEQALWGVEFELDGPPLLLGDPWSERQDRLLQRLWEGPLESKIVARLCGRTLGAVAMRAAWLRDENRWLGPWEADQQQHLTPDQVVAYYNAGLPLETMLRLHPEFTVQQMVETIEFALRFCDHEEDGPEHQLHRAPWSEHRDDILVRLWLGPLHSRVIARLCGRSHRSVVLRATALRDAGEQMWFEGMEE